MLRKLPVLVAILGVAVSALGSDQRARETVLELPHFVRELMDQWGVPGVSVAVVRDGSVLYAGGYGRRELSADGEVDADTIFAASSTTKGFTAAAAGMLVDEGSLKLDRPVVDFLPGFTLHDPALTTQLTVRDLLAHRTGIRRHDAVWYRSDATRDELINRLRYIVPHSGIRETFLYNNLMYMVAGRIIGRVTGGTWEEFVSRRIFEPLAMTRSGFGTPDLDGPNVAAPHGTDDRGETVAWQPYTGWAVAPASGITSTANDMARWLQMLLSDGVSGDRRLLSQDAVREMFTPQMALAILGPRESPIATYGLGWFAETYRGRLMVWHTGSIDGYYAMVAMLPSDGLGIVVLTNRSRHHLPEVLTRWVFDRLLGLPEINWQNRYWLQEEAVLEATRQAVEAREEIRKPGTETSLPSHDLVGRYRHPAYGEIEIATSEDGLTASLHGMLGRLEHFHDDAFIYHLDGFDLREEFIIRFQYASDRTVASLAASMENDSPPVVFLRLGEEPKPPVE